MFVFINGLGALHNDRLKYDHPLGVPLPSLYTFELN